MRECSIWGFKGMDGDYRVLNNPIKTMSKMWAALGDNSIPEPGVRDLNMTGYL